MNVQHWKENTIKETIHHVDVRELYSKDTAQIMHILLKPGEELKPHLTPVDVAFFVIEGTGTVLIGKEKQVVRSGTLIDSPKMIAHCWYNTGERDLRILVVKAPRPTSKSIIL
jgi:mannose-6-phosphate isomerase-like protein (cupin superfamily)